MSRYPRFDLNQFVDWITVDVVLAKLKAVRFTGHVEIGDAAYDLIFNLESGKGDPANLMTDEEARIYRRIALNCGKHSVSASFDPKFGWMTYANVYAFAPKTPTGDDDLVIADLLIFTQMLTVMHRIVCALTDSHFPMKRTKR